MFMASKKSMTSSQLNGKFVFDLQVLRCVIAFIFQRVYGDFVHNVLFFNVFIFIGITQLNSYATLKTNSHGFVIKIEKIE